MGTDKDWEKWGATEPYFGVLSNVKYRRNKLNQLARNAFFESGENHVIRVFKAIRDNFDPQFSPRSVLDFGCGVGRLIIPFARHADKVVGVDVSTSMLSEAKRNCELTELAKKITLAQSGDPSCIESQFDLVHSFIVLQHIPWQRGRQILQALSGLVSKNGYLAVHIFTSCNTHPIVRLLVRLRYCFPPANWVRNIMSGRHIFEPAMQLHVYDMDTIMHDLEVGRFGKILCLDEPTGCEFDSIFLFAQRI